MKAKFYFGILSALLLAGYPLKAQIADNRNTPLLIQGILC
jgi:hypothetical protein